MAGGRLTLERAQELLEALWLKFNEIVLLRSSSSARYFAGFPIGFNIAIVSCQLGLHTRGGTAGVGSATTRAVVVTSVVTLIGDFLLTKLILTLEGG